MVGKKTSVTDAKELSKVNGGTIIKVNKANCPDVAAVLNQDKEVMYGSS